MSIHKLDDRALRRMVDKAAWLIETGRVVRISNIMFYVMGKRNRHIVKIEGDKLACTCPGYKDKGICSHVLAVMAILEMKDGLEYLDEKIRKRIRKEWAAITRGGYRA